MSQIIQILEAAKDIQQELVGAGVVKSPKSKVHLDINSVFDFLIDDPDIRECSEDLFKSKKYKHAVTDTYVCLNNFIKSKSGLNHLDGPKLMRHAFSLSVPKLKLNDLRTMSQKDEQEGYMNIFAGCMIGIRNPRSHEHKLQDHPEIALEMLVFANHLMKKAKIAKRTRARKKVK